MDAELENLLNSRMLLVENTFSWGETGRLQLTYYLSNEQPPLKYVTSVRSVVFQANSMMVVRDAENSYHIFPGGSPKQGEALEETLRREVLEETGLRPIDEVRKLSLDEVQLILLNAAIKFRQSSD